MHSHEDVDPAGERVRLFWQYLRAGMTVAEAWSQAVLDEGRDRA